MPADVPKDAARRIKSIRTQYGLRQIELADRLGVTQVTVSRWEQAKSTPQPSYWRRIELAEKKGLKWLTESEEWARAQSPTDGNLVTRDFLADSERCWAYLEAQRLAASHQVNPTFAKESSLVDPLPHQDIAVYEHMMTQHPLRFLLADDAGAGKTIMTGLYIVEKLSRRQFDRILIVPPAGLVTNWQRELRKFFSLDFEILRSSDFHSGNAFLKEEMSQAIISLDTLRQPHIFKHLRDHALQPYDLVVFDEAHKLAARIESDGTPRKTDRYRMAEAICGAKDADRDWRLNWKAENVLLLTATPHMGKDIPYWYLWRLLDPESFCTKQAFDDLGMEARRAHFIRRTKEEMVNQDGIPIYPPRRTNTFGFNLDDTGDANERLLYNEMTEYLNNQYNLADPLDSSATQLALSVFQRRMASSTAALHCSLNNRSKRIEHYIQLVKEEGLEALIFHRNEQRQRVRSLQYDQTTFDEFSDDPSETIAPDDDDSYLNDDDAVGWTAAATLEDLETELTELERLTELSQATLDTQRESKFDRMMELLEGDLADEKVLIFTEHKDTLDYIIKRLSKRGYAGQIAQIHGGLNAQPSRATGLSERDVQADFFRKPTEEGGARFLIATDAAGEGINLQFCWIMVNYDLPWNPARLEQRMGRIHRYGQKRDEVYILNLLANDTREGRVMQTLLAKIEQIRKDLGRDKVFDSVGEVLDISPSRWLRQMLSGTKSEDELKAEVENIEAGDVERRLNDHEAAQGESSSVRERVEDIRQREDTQILRRMLPGYVANFVRRATPILNMQIQGDATAKFSLSANDLQAQACLEEVFSGYPSAWNTEMTVERPTIGSQIIFLHPGEAAFDRLLSQTQMLCENDMKRGTCFVTEAVNEPRMLTFLRMRVVRRADPTLPALKKEITLDERLIAISVDYDGHCKVEDSSILLELASCPEIPDSAISMTRRADDLISRASSYSREVHAVLSLQQTVNAVRERNDKLRTRVRTGLKRREAELAERRNKLRKKARDKPTKNLQLSLAKIRNEQRNIETHRRQRLAELDQEPLLIELDDIAAVGTVLLVPPSSINEGMTRDDAVEQVAMEWSERFERLHGAQVIDVTTAEKATAAGLNPHPGFDLLSIRPDGERRAIEVKGRAKEGIVQLSANEWARAINERQGYYLYVVFDCASETPNGHVVRDPAGCLFDPEVSAVRFDAQQIKNAAEAIS